MSKQKTDIDNTGHRIRLLSYNVQAGISTTRYRHYFTQSWRHLFPHKRRLQNLNKIAEIIAGYDVVGLQEVDTGSLRSSFTNLTEYLAEQADFPFWHDQTNRKIGRIARHATGLISRFKPSETGTHKLPGRIPGRNLLASRFGQKNHSLHIFVVHLSLGNRARMEQLAYIKDLVNTCEHVILMGDMNFKSRSKEMDYLLSHTRLCEPVHDLHTYPSWGPKKSIDHILVSDQLAVENVQVLKGFASDHLPIAMEVRLPGSIHL